MAVALDWCKAAPPPLLYHGTADRFLTVIQTEGLKPMHRHHVHLSPDIETATCVGARQGKPVILEVRVAALAQDGQPFYLTSNQVWLAESVPPRYLDPLD